MNRLNLYEVNQSKNRMNERKELLSSHASQDNPFRMPEGYLEGLEESLMARIAAEEAAETQQPQRPVWRILKPALTLAATFAIIFGMGYGVLSLTHTLDRGLDTASDYASVEEEMIRTSSLYNYYTTGGQIEEETLDEECMVDYLAYSLSYTDLAEIYAQSYQQ